MCFDFHDNEGVDVPRRGWEWKVLLNVIRKRRREKITLHVSVTVCPHRTVDVIYY